MTGAGEPKRDLDGPDVAPEWREALRAGRRDALSVSQRSRLRKSVLGTIRAGGVAGAVSSATAAAATKTTLGVAGKLVVGGIVTAGIGIGVWAGTAQWSSDDRRASSPVSGRSSEDAKSGAPRHETSAVARTAPEPDAAAGAPAQLTPPETGEAAPRTPKGSPSGRADARAETRSAPDPRVSPGTDRNAARDAREDAGVTGEFELIRRAHQARQTDPGQALQLLARHRNAYPQGDLVQERAVIAVEALVHAGRPEAARRRGRRFLGDHPRSTYAPRIRRLLREDARGTLPASKNAGAQRTHPGETGEMR